MCVIETRAEIDVFSLVLNPMWNLLDELHCVCDAFTIVTIGNQCLEEGHDYEC